MARLAEMIGLKPMLSASSEYRRLVIRLAGFVVGLRLEEGNHDNNKKQDIELDTRHYASDWGTGSCNVYICERVRKGSNVKDPEYSGICSSSGG